MAQPLYLLRLLARRLVLHLLRHLCNAQITMLQMLALLVRNPAQWWASVI